MPFPRASQALSRFTVLDLTRVRSGPTCVRQLADWGANVIKIETPPHLVEGEGPGGPREGSDFQNLQRNKRSMTLDLKSPQGLAAFKRLVEKADVVVENFRPDVKDRLGIDYDSLRKINKRIVLASISGFGQDGPYAKRPGFDQIAQGMGGLMSITGAPGGGPVRVGIPVADLTAGLVLRARHHDGAARARSLRRRPVGIDLAAAGADLHARLPGLALSDRRARCRSRPATIIRPRFRPACSRPRTAISISRSPAQVIWERFCNAVGHPEWIASPDYKTGKLRLQNRDALNAEIDKATATKSSAEWVEIFNKVGVPCGPIYSIDQVFADPQVKHLGIAQESARSDGSRLGSRRPAVQAVAHAEQDRGAAAESRRAHRRDSQGIRFRRR